MIVAPVVAKTVRESLAQIARANSEADAIELRLDYFEKLGEAELKRLIHACKKPCICTCRTHGEGGKFRSTEAAAAQVLMAAAKLGSQYVDIEFVMKTALRKKVSQYAKKHGAKIILSRHFTSHTPSKKELSSLLSKMAKEKSHVIKIVTKASKRMDNEVVLGLFRAAKKHKTQLIAFCMGEHGKDSRVLSRLLGAFASFASLGKDRKSVV